MIGISPKREYVRDGKITKIIVFELSSGQFTGFFSRKHIFLVVFTFVEYKIGVVSYPVSGPACTSFGGLYLTLKME
jgi:hypothetical protein